METKEIVEKVRRVLEIHPDIIFAYIFGSVAKGNSGKLSDIDIAVYFIQTDNILKQRLEIMRIMEKQLPGFSVDIVVLNKAPLSLKYMIEREGILLFEKDKERRVFFETSTRKEYWDFEPRLKIYARYMAKRLKEGSFGT